MIGKGFRYTEDAQEFNLWKKTIESASSYTELHLALMNWCFIFEELNATDFQGRACVGRRMHVIITRMNDVMPPEVHWTPEETVRQIGEDLCLSGAGQRYTRPNIIPIPTTERASDDRPQQD